MKHDAAAILAKIEAAFPAHRAARFEPLVDSLQDGEPLLTAEAFADKDDWTSLEGRWLDEAPDGWASALSFLSDEAVCFYVSAYIAADIRSELERVEPIFQLVSRVESLSQGQAVWLGGADTEAGGWKRRWSSLSTEQATAIVHYMEWRIERDGGFIASLASEALATFWYGRANLRNNAI